MTPDQEHLRIIRLKMQILYLDMESLMRKMTAIEKDWTEYEKRAHGQGDADAK